MPISIDWGTKVIYVPQNYLTFVSGTVYQLEIDDFRLQLKNLEDDLAGMPYMDTHRHIAPVTLSGATYSRFVEIINGYTITFEDGLYQVNLSGANSNVVDVLNRNSVSVVSNNSSGLISLTQLEYSSFNNRITIDTERGVSGISFPIGTAARPVNNITDALLISQTTGISELYFKHSYTIPAGTDLEHLQIRGENQARVLISLENGVITHHTEFSNCTIEGYLGDWGGITDCHLLNIFDVSTDSGLCLSFYNSVLEASITISSSEMNEMYFFNCKSGCPGLEIASLDANGSTYNIFFRDYTGELRLKNLSAGNVGALDIMSGQIVIDPTCTDAEITIRGNSKITNDASGNANFTLIDETIITDTDIDSIAGAVWNKMVADHLAGGTFGEKVGKKLLNTSKFIALK